jgi:membrane fusion protein, multidrug efflux system
MNRCVSSTIASPAAAALLLAFALACGGDQAPPGTAPEDRVPTVRVRLAEPRLVRDTASLPADLRARRRATLAAEIAGTVETLRVEEGDAVRAGQTLFAVDRRALEQQVAEAAAVHQQRQLQLERAQNLFERQSITKAQLLDAITNHDVAQSALASTRVQLQKATVTAPWAGTVVARRVEVGDYVQPGQAAIELAELVRLEVEVAVAASDSPFIEVGQPVSLTVDAFPGERFQATVTRISPQIDPATRTLGVQADLPNPDRRLRPGMPARLELVRREWPSAVTVPRAALVELEGQRVVYVIDGDAAHRRVVAVGPLVGDEVVIEEGLTGGELVVVEGQRQVSDGQRVQVSTEGPRA